MFDLYHAFAGFYWRIIRVNGDGSLRIMYDGTQAYANGVSSSNRFIGNSSYNSKYDDNKYVGWMYGPAGVFIVSYFPEPAATISSAVIKPTGYVNAPFPLFVSFTVNASFF